MNSSSSPITVAFYERAMAANPSLIWDIPYELVTKMTAEDFKSDLLDSGTSMPRALMMKVVDLLRPDFARGVADTVSPLH